MELAERLRERRSEIEAATLARVHAVSDPGEVEDPEYALGLREAVGAGIAYAIAAIDAPRGAEAGPVPDRLLAQARAAARNGVPLETVLRRYSAAYTLLSDFAVREVGEGGLKASDFELKRCLRAVSALFDSLVATISAEYTRAAEGRRLTLRQRHAECVEGLLAGELLNADALNYDLDAWHVGVVAAGSAAGPAVRHLAATLGRPLLLVDAGGGRLWAWLGGRQKVPARTVLRVAERNRAGGMALGLGEPARRIEGWRLTHRQARAALPVALRGRSWCARYADVALLASALCDDTLARSLEDLYLAPLSQERDGGRVLRETLRAYLDAECNVTSAASLLKVSRKTVNNRLRAAEGQLERSIGSCVAEMDTALRLEEIGDGAGGTPRHAGSLPNPGSIGRDRSRIGSSTAAREWRG